MPPANVRVLNTATEGQIEALTMLCVRAYGEHDKALDALLGGNHELSAPYWRSMIRAALLEGAIYVATESEDSDDFRAIGIWYGPGHSYLGSEEQKKLGFNDFFNSLSQETKDWWTNEYTPLLDGFLKEVYGPSKALNYWFANCIATDPPYQRKGYGTALVRDVFQKSDDVPVALGTPSENNAIWYNSLGFKTVGRSEVPAPTGSFTAFFFIWVDKSIDRL